MPQNRERLPSEPLRAIGSRVLSRESHIPLSMSSNGWALRPETTPCMFRKRPNQRKPWGALTATGDPVLLHCGHEGRRGF
jgi:hypothetical protein